MELKLLKKQKNFMQLQLVDADETLLYPLVYQLLKDENVQDASYMVGHPDLDIPVLTVQVKDGKPQAALKKAVKALASEFSGAGEKIEKKLG